MKRFSILSYFFFGVMFFILMSVNSFAQEGKYTVTGRVFPAGMRTPMSGVTVQIKGDPSTATQTDGDGWFEIKVPMFPVELEFIKPDYKTQHLKVTKESEVLVYMIAGGIKNDYGKKIGVRVSLNPESRDGILTLSSDDKRFKYWFDNRVYVDGAVYFGDNTYHNYQTGAVEENKIGNGVNIRRMRFAMKTILWGHWGGEIDFDFAYNEVDIKDAFIRYIGKNWQVKAGNFKEPFSMEVTTTSRYLTFIERPMTSKMDPSRHLGISYRRFGNHYFFEGGFFSSTVANDAMQQQNKKQGTNAGWSTTGRVAWAPIKKDKTVLHFGSSASYRKPKLPEFGDPINSFRYSTRAETSINRKKYIDTDFIENSESSVLYGFELAFANKNFKVGGEYFGAIIYRDASKVPTGQDKPTSKGFFVYGAWIINNGDYYYNMAEAEFSQIDFRNNKKGAFEVAVRYSYLNVNSFTDDSQIPYIAGGAGEGYAFELNYYLNYNIKFMLNYTYINHDRWANGKGKYLTYDIDENGQDITPTGKGGIDFSMIQVRAEIDF
jgi:phosphate-selective porin OprO/OprP